MERIAFSFRNDIDNAFLLSMIETSSKEIAHLFLIFFRIAMIIMLLRQTRIATRPHIFVIATCLNLVLPVKEL